MKDKREEVIEKLKDNGISNIDEAVTFLESKDIKVERWKKNIFSKKKWILTFPYQDTDLAIPDKEEVIKFCRKNKEQIKLKWERWKIKDKK